MTWLIFRIDLRASSFWFKCFIRTSLRCSFFELGINKDPPFQRAHRFGIQHETGRLWLKCCCNRLLVQFTFNDFSQKRWKLKLWCHLWLLLAMSLKTFYAESNILDASAFGLVQSRDKAEMLFRRFYYIDRGTICFPDIVYFCSELNKIFWIDLRWFDPSEKRAN